MVMIGSIPTQKFREDINQTLILIIVEKNLFSFYDPRVASYRVLVTRQ